MSEEYEWKSIIAHDAHTNETIEVSYHAATGRYRINGIDVERKPQFERENEAQADIYTYIGEGIIHHVSLEELERLR